MRLKCIATPAKFVPVDSFIYIKKKRAFFFVDDKDIDDGSVIFFFEEGFNKNGLIEHTLSFREDEELFVVSQYEVNEEELIKEIEEIQKSENKGS